MKKYLLYLFFISLCVIWIMIIITPAHEMKGSEWKKVNTCFSVRNQQGNIDSIKCSNNTIILYFQPGCDACEHEVHYFIDHRADLRSHYVYYVYFISDASLDEILQFSLPKGIDTISGFKVLQDHKGQVKKEFRVDLYPTVLFFDATGKLTQRLEGEISFSKILPLIQKL